MWQALKFELAGVPRSGSHAPIQGEKMRRNTLFQHMTHNPVTPVVKGISGCASPTCLLSNKTIPPKKDRKNPLF